MYHLQVSLLVWETQAETELVEETLFGATLFGWVSFVTLKVTIVMCKLHCYQAHFMYSVLQIGRNYTIENLLCVQILKDLY